MLQEFRGTKVYVCTVQTFSSTSFVISLDITIPHFNSIIASYIILILMVNTHNMYIR